MYIRGIRRTILYLNFILFSFLEIILRELGYQGFTLPQHIVFIAFVVVEAMNIFSLRNKGMYCCFTCPIFCVEVLCYYGAADWITETIIGFAVIVFIMKGIEFWIVLQKRLKGNLYDKDYFSCFAEAAIIASVLFDVTRLQHSFGM